MGFKYFISLKDYTKEPYSLLVNNTTLDRQTAEIFVLSSGNVTKYDFLTGRDVLLVKDLLERAATKKTFEYFP